jgi:signal transduction histidine kinase
MIDQLLDFTRIRLQGGIPVSLEPSDLALVGRQVIDELDDANPNCELRLQILGDARGFWDTDRLSQVLSNLVANAIHHGDRERGVDVTIDGAARERVVVKVHNVGLIPAELLPKLFEPLVAVRSLENSSGLGLGLYITKEIVGAHGGSIEARSTDDGGTTLIVSLPRGRLAVDTEDSR